MYFKKRISTAHLIAVLIMVAPATAYTNLNALGTNSAQTTPFTQTTNSAIAQAMATSSTWFSETGATFNTQDLMRSIADAAVHGLNPESYGLKSLEQELITFVAQSEQSGAYHSESSEQFRLNLEQKLYSSFASLSRDLGQGILDAQKTQRMLYREAPVVDTDALIGRLDSGRASVGQLLAELTPSTDDYKGLVEQMRTLLNEREIGVTRTQVRYVESVVLYTQDSSIIDLRTRLKETGDLPEDSQLNLRFDDDIVDALKAVQARNGLTVTGEINESTIVALNTSIDSDIREVAMNLERWRWMPRDLGYQHIFINVPAYDLKMVRGDQQIVDMPVVVGSTEHQTPVFSEDAKFIEVAPTWTVPASITNKELVAKELKKPGYFKSQRMDLFQYRSDKLVKVPHSSMTRADLKKKRFPYVVRQRSGPGNALGEVKILMPNKYAIYMHDTQAKKLFAKTDRAYSHGCIRLSDPFRLSSLLLQLDGRSVEETDKILAKKKTHRVTLDTTTPTHISYFTAWVGEDGRLNRRKDVYKHNESLIEGLLANNTLLTTLQNRPITVLAEQDEL